MHFYKPAIAEQLSFSMNRASTRREPLARGHLQEVAAVERKNRLHQAFAEGRRPDDERAIVIL